MREHKFSLVLEDRPGDFMPVDINLLIGNRYPLNFSTLETIDAWTKKYYESEIMKMIRDNNIVPEKYFTGKLQIINEKKFRYPIMTKIHYLPLDVIIKDHISDKQMMNKLVNIYQKYETNYLTELKEAVKNQNLNNIIGILNSLSYEKIRNIYMYFDQM